MTTTTQVDQAKNDFLTAAAIQKDIAQGSDTTSVQTETGLVPTVAKAVKDISDSIQTGASSALSLATVQAGIATTKASEAAADAQTASTQGALAVTAWQAAQDPMAILAAINATITTNTNPVQIHIWDTRQDTIDWRKKVTNTGWYNETLTTSTRGSRRELPTVFATVLEATKLTIIDCDTPTLPMWRVFSGSSGILDWATSGAVTQKAASYLNGKLSVVSSSGGVVFDFNAGKAYPVYLSGYNFNAPTDFSAFAYTSSQDSKYRTTLTTNALHDSCWYSPKDGSDDWLIVASETGLSITKGYGTTPIIISEQTYSKVFSVAIYQRRLLFVIGTSIYQYWIILTDIIDNLSSVNFSYSSLPVGWNSFYYTGDSTNNFVIGSPSNGYSAYFAAGQKSLPLCNNISALLTGKGVSLIRPNLIDIKKSMRAEIASNYNTGYMTGDCVLALGADTDFASSIGDAELVTNGTFDIDTDWTDFLSGSAGGTVIITGGKLSITQGSNSVWMGASQAIPTVVGKTYVVSGEYNASGNFGRIYVGLTAGSTGIASSNAKGSGTHYLSFVATGTTTYITLIDGSGAGVTSTWDNVSVREGVPDRSVKNNPFQAFGNLSVSPIGSGNDQLAIGGFSATNYLHQKHLSDFEFGTSDFSIELICSTTNATSGVQYFIVIRDPAAYTADKGISVNIYNGKAAFLKANGASWQDLLVGTSNIDDGEFHHIVVARESGTIYLYVDGEMENSASYSNDLTDSLAEIKIGNDFVTDLSDPSSLIHSVKITKTAMSKNQVSFAYHAILNMLVNGAQTTLYGSSDDVLDQDYDSVTDTWHGVTSAGRSSFNGLVRVSENQNTASKVGAKDNLILEV